ncbi:hypothetical protein GTQ99_00910 [Kineococcus sp. T13]|uniref:DUF7711 family protein n=1 Tax=Kineococcus vitellinus TaxID=2696565 RepID=UPI001411C1DA|nr:hypothetical protein [Kineococcus vitellinus]NAZ73991.1 hypothetical protein [Kineococcus vitellinus]
MKWTTAVRVLEEVAQRCAHVDAQPAAIVPLRVVEAWVHGALLGPRAQEVPDEGGVAVALVADVPPAACAWRSRPPGAGQWLAASGLARRPVELVLRPAGAPVWNHAVRRPVRFWSAAQGTDEAVLAAVRAGDGERLRPPAPAPAELAARLEAELELALAQLRRTGADYAAHRWEPGSPLARADALSEAALGYLELLDARGRLAP